MASPDLCAALVNSGALSMQQLVGLLARQTVRGGKLDTILLEDGLVDEGTVVGILSDISGYPPMRTAWMDNADKRAAMQLPRRVAEQHNICPVALENRRLTVLVAHDTCPVTLSELAYELDMELVPLVTPEVRLAQLRNQLYRCRISDRHARLLDKLGPLRPGPRRVVVGSESEPSIELPMLRPRVPRRPTRRTLKQQFFGLPTK